MQGSFLENQKILEIMKNLKDKKILNNHRKLKQAVVLLKIQRIQIKKLGTTRRSEGIFGKARDGEDFE